MDPLCEVEPYKAEEWVITKSGVQLSKAAYKGGFHGIIIAGKGVVKEGAKNVRRRVAPRPDAPRISSTAPARVILGR